MRAANAFHPNVPHGHGVDWIWWVDQRGQLLWVSPMVESACGYTDCDCFAMRDYPLPIIHPDDRAAMRDFIRQDVLAACERDFRFVHRSGSVLRGTIDLRRHFDSEGKLLGTCYSAHDTAVGTPAEIRLHGSLRTQSSQGMRI